MLANFTNACYSVANEEKYKRLRQDPEISEGTTAVKNGSLRAIA